MQNGEQEFNECRALMQQGDAQRESALALLQRSAELGYVPAQSMMSGLHFYDNWGMRDDAKARYWAEQAAVAEDPDALTILGVLYLEGRGVPPDAARAVQYLERAAARGSMKAFRYLGNCYSHGSGVPQDDGKAADLYRKGAEAGDITSQYLLGTCYENGRGVPQDLRLAVTWYERSAARGDAISAPAREALERLAAEGLLT